MWPTGDFTWGAAGAWASFLALCAVIVRQVGPWRKQSIDAEKSFRDDLINRVTRLEQTLERERVYRDAERAVDRHRLNNVTQCFDAVMMMLKASPDRATDIIVHIEKMRAEQLKAEAIEKSAIHEMMMKNAVGIPE
jgi:hypothetical protein